MGRHTYAYPRPAVTVDLVVFGVAEGALNVLLIRRKSPPFSGRWAIPGGFLEMDEPFEVAARRELREETGLDLAGPVSFLGVFGDPGRDPRARTISVAHAAAVPPPLPDVAGGDDAGEAAWVPVADLGPLAFDHDEMIGAARAWLVDRVLVGSGRSDLLSRRFRVDDVATMLRAVLDMPGRELPFLDEALAPEVLEAWIVEAIARGEVKALKRPAGVFARETARGAEPPLYHAPFVEPPGPIVGPGG